MSNQQEKIYDLEERTAKFGENIIDFVKKISKNNINNPIANQLIRSGTSVGQIIVKLIVQKVKKILNIK